MSTVASQTRSTVGRPTASDIRIVREYPHPRAKVWRAITDPALIALWGMRPEGFIPTLGNRFKLIGQPNRAWRGFVECEVVEVREPSVISYEWVDNDGAQPRRVTYTLEETSAGTRLILEDVGWTGISGFLLSKLMMVPGWKKTLGKGIPAVLADLSADGSLRAGSKLKPLY